MAKTSIGVSGLRVMVEYGFQAKISAICRAMMKPERDCRQTQQPC
jgi:hypothetical protein